MDYTINTYFDKIFVITCKHLTERQKYIKEHFDKCNLTNYWFIKGAKKNKFDNYTISNSAKSLIHAHIQCILKAQKYNFKKILICEDDVNFTSCNLNYKFNMFINCLPDDWHFLQLGNQFWTEKEHPEWLQVCNYNRGVNKFYWGTGSHCIGINSNVFDACLKSFYNMKEPVDFLYYNLYNKYNCYSPKIFLADSLSKQKDWGNNSDKHIFVSEIKHGFTNT